MENTNSAGGRRRGTTKSSAEDQALDQIAKEVSFIVLKFNIIRFDSQKFSFWTKSVNLNNFIMDKNKNCSDVFSLQINFLPKCFYVKSVCVYISSYLYSSSSSGKEQSRKSEELIENNFTKVLSSETISEE